jgi:hypothetical protein
VDGNASSSLGAHLRAIGGYLLTAVAFNWPLPAHMGTSFTGPVGGDTGVYVWNLWLFRHEIVAHSRFPLFTREILSLSPPVDLSLHNYTLFANVLAFPLIPLFGVPATFNLIYLGLVVLTAWAMFALARTVIGRDGEAWLAGLLFGLSPTLVARSTGHFSLVAAAPLPLFLLCMIRLQRHRRARDAALAGAVVAWATMCDAYYGIFCLLIGACYVASISIRLPAAERRAGFRTLRSFDALIAATLVLIVAILATGGGRVEWRGLVVRMESLYTPVLLLTIAVMARTWLAHPRRFEIAPEAFPLRVALKMTAAAGIAGFLLLSPVLYALRERLRDGGGFHGPLFWRSSPPGVDLLALFSPNPNQPLFGGPWRAWLATQPSGYIENVASLTLVGLAIVAVAAWRYRFRPPAIWVTLTAFFSALALGPFVHVAGVNTYIPGPWALLRYVPIVTATRTPARFDVVAVMAFALLFGLALAHLGDVRPERRRVLLVGVGCLLAFELAPAPRTLYSASVPAIYRQIADDPRDVTVLEIPFGVRDGEWSDGDFTAASQFYQTVHEKPLIGGYLSRISPARRRRLHERPLLDRLMRLSEGRRPRPLSTSERRQHGSRLLRSGRLAYVVIDTARTPPQLKQLAIEALRLTKVSASDGRELYVVTGRELARR